MNDHIDLFSGIGGFALAARWNGVETRLFVELDPFCQRVLQARFGAVTDTEQSNIGRGTSRLREQSTSQEKVFSAEFYNWFTCENSNPLLIPDIRDVDGTRFRGSWLLTGGFPCQPFSCAGKRKGTADNRFLWPEMCRVIREAQPEWVLAENVSGLLSQDGGMVFESVLTDLEDAGYETLPLVILACGVGAPHKRDRVWIVARSIGNATISRMRNESFTSEQDSDRAEDGISEQTDCHTADTPSVHAQGFLGRQEQVQLRGSGWSEPWLEVATRLCRVDDGLPKPMDRVNRLKALGNSIVPQIAYEIIKALILTPIKNKLTL